MIFLYVVCGGMAVYLLAYIAAKQAIESSCLADKMDVHNLHTHLDNVQNLVAGMVVKKLRKRRRKNDGN